MYGFKMTVFGRVYTIDYDFEGKHLFDDLNKIKEDIKQPHILSLGGSHIISIKGMYDDSFFQLLEAAKLTGNTIGGADFVEYLLSVSDEDTEWTAWRNRDLTGTYFRKITFHDDFADVVISECDRLIVELAEKIEAANAEEAAKKAAEDAEKARVLSGILWNTTEQTIFDEGGKTTEYIYTMTLNGKTYKLTDRNVFDVGRVVNYDDGMICRNDDEYIIMRRTGDGWTSFQLTDDEQRIAEAATKYGKYAKSRIRM